jgi:hypothetical protein
MPSLKVKGEAARHGLNRGNLSFAPLTERPSYA